MDDRLSGYDPVLIDPKLWLRTLVSSEHLGFPAAEFLNAAAQLEKA